MSEDAAVRAILATRGTLRFPSNAAYGHGLAAAGGRLIQEPSGHRVLYGREGRRIAYLDPGGQLLHECEWTFSSDGTAHLTRARVWLDWHCWVGIVPSGLVNATTLDLSTRAGWQRLRADDLRQMAARAMGVPLSEVQWFYTDDDLRIDARGQATIRHRKDALYVLPTGGFEDARFMACMGAMHWQAIDFLPVVELFQSLLPGTGSAVLELIRALYDDQNPQGGRPLRYRGMPTYPSEAAFRLFSGFFTAVSPSGTQPLALFMDAPRSHEVTWLPAPRPLRRLCDPAQRLCVTVRDRQITKVTCAGDATGLSFSPADGTGVTPGGRRVDVQGEMLVLEDGPQRETLALDPAWGPLAISQSESSTAAAPGWRTLFADGSPTIEPVDAYGAVLLYPEDDREIDPVASQPFVADYLQDLCEQDPSRAALVARARSVLIRNFDAVLTTLVPVDRPRRTVIVYQHAAFAQRQAQQLWNQAARRRQWDWFGAVTMRSVAGEQGARYQQTYDLIYDWLTMRAGEDVAHLTDRVAGICRSLTSGGVACVVGPSTLQRAWTQPGIRLLEAVPVSALPMFRMHQTILPKARLQEGLTLFQITKVSG